MDSLETNFLKTSYHISTLGWCRSLRSGSTGVGYTYESLCGIQENNSRNADICGEIELKTFREPAKGKLSLFTLSPKNEPLVMTKLHQHCSVVDKRGFKTLYSTVKGHRFNNFKKSFRFKISVDRDVGCLRLLITDVSGSPVNINASYTFEEIEQATSKLRKLALVGAKVKRDNDGESFSYGQATIYRFKGVDTFLDLIESGVIAVDLRLGVYKTGSKAGQTHDHGTAFRIPLKKVGELFEKIN